MKEIKISVCIPAYNQGLYVEKTIRSVVNQTLPPDEIIVFNDCSTDNTKEILEQLSKEIDILKIFHQKDNVGIVQNVNDLLKKAKGDFIVRIDSDDLLLPRYIEYLSILLNKYPDAGYAHAAVKEIDQCDNWLKDRKLFRTIEFQTSEESLKQSLKGYKVAANIVMFRREVLETVDYIKSPYNFAEDFYLTADIAAHNYGNVYCNKVLACYRIWIDNDNLRNKRKLEEIKGMNAVFSDVLLPAYIKKNWDIKKIEKAKRHFTQIYSDCLSLDIYTDQEKKVLEQALLALSSSIRVKVTIIMYKKGFDFLFKLYGNIEGRLRFLVKHILFKILNK